MEVALARTKHKVGAWRHAAIESEDGEFNTVAVGMMYKMLMMASTNLAGLMGTNLPKMLGGTNAAIPQHNGPIIPGPSKLFKIAKMAILEIS